MNKTALITGATGQDGSYLAEFLLEKDYKVVGLVRRTSNPTTRNINHILDKIEIVSGDLSDLSSLIKVIETSQPDEVYNLASQSFVPTSWQQPILTGDITGLGVLRILEAIKIVNKNIKFYQASSSEMFGKVRESPQNELTPFYPRSPYGAAKVYGHWITVNYRESYDMFTCSGIAFNHESPRRGIEFVTRKITDAVARIKLGLQDKLYLGNLEAKRDWGYAGDFVRAMWLMLQQDTPDDYVIGTGVTHSIREFCDAAFRHVDLDYNNYVIQDPKFYRPAEVQLLLADPTKIFNGIGWYPKVSFEELVKRMVINDLDTLEYSKEIMNGM